MSKSGIDLLDEQVVALSPRLTKVAQHIVHTAGEGFDEGSFKSDAL